MFLRDSKQIQEMPNKTLYDVLGIPQNANADQVRRAYVVRTKLMHPDRFNPVSQAEAWALANELLSELNDAYAVLRDSSKRATYDLTLRAQSAGSQPTNNSTPSDAAKEDPIVDRQAGWADFQTLHPNIQQKLLARVGGKNNKQFALNLSGIAGNYFWVFVVSFWFIVIFFSPVTNIPWRGGDLHWRIGITGFVAFVLAKHMNVIITSGRSKLGAFLIVTPLYILKTHLDQIWYWPIWTLTGLEFHRNPKGTNSNRTTAHLTFGSAVEMITLSSGENGELFKNAVLASLERFDQALKEQNVQQFFVEHDDFKELEPTARPRPLHRSAYQFVIIFLLSTLFSALIFLFAYLYCSSGPVLPVPPVPPENPIKMETQVTLKAHSYQKILIELPKTGYFQLSVDVSSGNEINVYLMEKAREQEFTRSKSTASLKEYECTDTKHYIRTALLSQGSYICLVEDESFGILSSSRSIIEIHTVLQPK